MEQNGRDRKRETISHSNIQIYIYKNVFRNKCRSNGLGQQQLIDEELNLCKCIYYLDRSNFPTLENSSKIKGKPQSKRQSFSVVKVIRWPTLYDIGVIVVLFSGAFTDLFSRGPLLSNRLDRDATRRYIRIYKKEKQKSSRNHLFHQFCVAKSLNRKLDGVVGDSSGWSPRRASRLPGGDIKGTLQESLNLGVAIRPTGTAI